VQFGVINVTVVVLDCAGAPSKLLATAAPVVMFAVPVQVSEIANFSVVAAATLA